MYITRVSFGTALIASLVIVYLAIIAILRGSNSDDRERSYGGGGFYSPGFFYFSPFDLFWFYDPYYYQRPPRPADEMNFLEAVFSFVFGDGDPNDALEDTRYRLLGEAAAANGGVLVAEQIAPFADSEEIHAADPTDESYVLPALMRFNGEAEVTDDGTIVYKFPDLQVTAGGRSELAEGATPGAFLEEGEYGVSRATRGQIMLAAGLGVANFVGVAVLSVMLADPATLARAAGSGVVKLAAASLPFLQVYAVAYFAIPALRFALAMRRNAAIKRRNEARMDAARRMAYPDAALQAKLAAAAMMGRRRTVSDSDVVYGSDGSGRAAAMEDGTDDWESKFNERYK